MNRFISVILLSLLLASAICSCRSSKHSAVEYSDSTSVSTAETATTLSKDEINSIISASRELDLSGIKVEFFPPDSARPDSRAVPKSLTIETAKSKETASQTTEVKATASEQKTATLSAQSVASLQHDSQSDNSVLLPADRVLIVTVVVVALLAAFSITFALKHRR